VSVCRTELGTPIYFEEHGAGELAVVFIHGWFDNLKSFQALSNAISIGRRILLDLPGHGHSGHLSCPYTIDRYISEILSLLDILALKHVVLIGHSLGAGICSTIAAMAPNRVRSLVLLDAVTVPVLNETETVSQLRKGAQFFRQPLPAAVYASREEALKVRMLFSGLSRSAAEVLIDHDLKVDGQSFSSRCDQRLHLKSHLVYGIEHVRQIMSEISCRCFVAIPMKGVMIRYKHELELLKLVKNISVNHYAGCHHFHMENPISLAHDITNFLTSYDD
jgi:pimeloyl-ACP methyl ester carboxylesterase